MNILIRHEWEPKNEAKAFETVQAIVKMAREGSMPAGFKLVSAYVDAASKSAFCIYEAPSKQAFSELVSKINPPTKYTIYEASKLF